MFTTFTVAPCPLGYDQLTASSRSMRRRPVSRACSWCRIYRVKCDDNVPCRNCVARGRRCTENGENEVRTLPLALREIERLKNRVTELEGQLNSHQGLLNPWKISARNPSFPEHLDALREHGGNRGSWEYIYTRAPRSQQMTCYGPASSVYFMGRMSAYIQKALAFTNSEPLQQSDAAFASLFCSAAAQPGPVKPKSLRRTTSTTFGQKPLSRWQEEYFLDFYWQSYHCMYPIINKTDLKSHHSSLWETPYEARKSSALVDIVLGVCMQYATALLPPDVRNAVVNAEEKGKDAATAGRSFYRRCHVLLAADSETPSLMTLQCYVLSAIYLFNAGSPNTAQGMLALACRTGMILGLHREPLDDLDDGQKDLHRRLWWTIYALDIKSAVEYGRAIAIQFSQVACSLPKDSLKTGRVPFRDSAVSPSCFTSNLQFIKLILAWRSIYITFWRKCAELLGPSHQNSLYGEPQSLEACAGFLSSKMEYLQVWLREVPEALKAKRREGGTTFSTDGTALDIRPMVPFLQQRQQIFLELHFHSAAMSLFRPFIDFSDSHSLQANCKTPLSEANAIACANHSMTITSIIHQMLTETDLVGGWLETFAWHSNAFLSLVGYVLAYPTGPPATEVRRAIRKAITTFDLLSSSLAMAASSARVARDLAAKADVLIDHFNSRSSGGSSSTHSDASLENHNLPGSDAPLRPEDPGPPDLIGGDVFRLVNDDFLLPETPLLFDLSSDMDWISMDGNHTSDTWTVDQDREADLFSLI